MLVDFDYLAEMEEVTVGSVTVAQFSEPALPGCEYAWIPEGKLEKYVLNPESEDGWGKAQYFSTELGIEQADWTYLHDQILERLPESEAIFHEETDWGPTWEVPMFIVGLNGCARYVTTGWITHPWEQGPKFTTAYPEKRSRRNSQLRVLDGRIGPGRTARLDAARGRPAPSLRRMATGYQGHDHRGL
jgi:hypothetical protein